MTTGRLISGLESRGVLLSLAEGEIRYRSPKGALTDTDKESLRGHRGGIVEYLQARNAAKALRGAPPSRVRSPRPWRRKCGGRLPGGRGKVRPLR